MWSILAVINQKIPLFLIYANDKLIILHTYSIYVSTGAKLAAKCTKGKCIAKMSS